MVGREGGSGGRAGRSGATADPRPRLRAEWALLAILPFVALSNALPHLPGDAADSPLGVPLELGDRALDAVRGDDVPYPVHVDEHYHIARFAHIERTGRVDIPDPYTNETEDASLFSVPGMRSERGWQVAMVQAHHLTGVSFVAMARFLPALWSAYLALGLWATLRPMPGALPAAALVGVLPTTVRFLGVGFLVPSAFAVPWILAVVAVAARGRGPGRLVALALLVTGAFFMHLVPGTLALAAGLLAALLRPGPVLERAGLAAAIALPLVWIYPAIASDAASAVGARGDLPFEARLFRSIGLPLLALVAAGSARAFYHRDAATVPLRALAILCGAITASLVWSIAAGHSNDATYTRLVPTFFLCLAALGGAGAAVGARAAWLAARRLGARAQAGRAVTVSVAALLVAVGLLVPLQAKLSEPYYRVFDEGSWAAAAAFGSSGAGPDDVFLSHPWEAPLLNAFTGARPWTVLYPGSPPERVGDLAYYQRSDGANATWLGLRGIGYVVDAVPPNAPHATLGPGAYRVGR